MNEEAWADWDRMHPPHFDYDRIAEWVVMRRVLVPFAELFLKAMIKVVD